MQCFINVFGTFLSTWNQPDKNPRRLFWCTAAICLKIIYREIQRLGMPIARKTRHVSLVGSTHDWHNRCSGRKLSLFIPPPIAWVVLPEDATILRGGEAHRFKIEVRLK
jgi:hypothetical protein